MFALRIVHPILIQDALQNPDHCTNAAVDIGLRRYLGVPIHNPNGQPIGTLCFLDGRIEEPLGEEDIHFLSLLAMRVSVELERERMVQARLEEQKRMVERLEATAKEKHRFVMMVIHDLRHPLTALRTILYLLRDESDPEQRAACVSALENRVDALSHLLNALQQYHEIEAGHTVLHLEDVNLAQLIEDCVQSFAPAFVSDSVAFERDIAPDLGVSHTDRDKLNHILLNLLSNALKFTPRGTVRVRARCEGTDRWLLEVEDTGIGMSEDIREQVFEEFYRAPDDRVTQTPGSGLGLNIVRRLSSALQAKLEMESAPGVGTRFRLLFPRHLEAAEGDTANAP